MKIDTKDLYHGAALTQIVEHPSFKALNKADNSYGHYLVNQNKRLFVKYARTKKSPWQFTFEKSHCKLLRDDFQLKDFSTFLCLVCGDVTVCLITDDQVKWILDLETVKTQWVRVSIPGTKARMRVTGSSGNLSETISHKRFPSAIFEPEKRRRMATSINDVFK